MTSDAGDAAVDGVAHTLSTLGHNCTPYTLRRYALQVLMSNADVALVGMVGSSCFAIDYYLLTRQTCQASDGQVRSPCPNTKESTPTEDLKP